MISLASAVSITFDDALASVYQLAFPEMERFGIVGTVFAISNLVGREYLGRPVMTKDMLLHLCSAGWEIGSHTMSHPQLGNLSDRELEKELELSKKQLVSLTGREVTGLAYPYGEFDNRVASTAAKHYLWARAVSSYPPLRLNAIVPKRKMGLKAMSSIEPGYTLPLHLYSTHVPLLCRKSLHGLVRERNPRFREGISAPRKSLSATVVRKWIRKIQKDDRWLILCFHDVTLEKESTSYGISFRELQQIVKAMASGPEVITLGNAFTRKKSL